MCRPCLPLASAPQQATGYGRRLLPLSKEQEESGFAAGAHTRRRMRRRRGRPTRRRYRASVGPGRGGTAGCGGEKSGCGSRRMAERGQGEPLPRELVSLAIRCFRNGTAPLPRLILRRCGPWLFRRSGGNGGAGGERREWWRVGGRREVDEWWGRCRRAGRDGNTRRAWSTRREGV